VLTYRAIAVHPAVIRLRGSRGRQQSRANCGAQKICVFHDSFLFPASDFQLAKRSHEQQ
jgi:hypothetical protein